MEYFIPYLHFLSIMVLMGSLISEHLILKPGISKEQVKSLATIDLIYGIAAILVLTTGILRWFIYGKGYDYYMGTPIFHIKLTLFVILGILSIFPTIKILKWRKQLKNNMEPEISNSAVNRLLMFIRIELLIVAIMPLLAVMIAQGV